MFCKPLWENCIKRKNKEGSWGGVLQFLPVALGNLQCHAYFIPSSLLEAPLRELVDSPIINSTWQLPGITVKDKYLQPSTPLLQLL